MIQYLRPVEFDFYSPKKLMRFVTETIVKDMFNPLHKTSDFETLKYLYYLILKSNPELLNQMRDKMIDQFMIGEL